MTQDETIELAKQAGLMADGEMWFSPTYGSGDVHISHLQTFTKLVAEKEREACALLCEEERINATHYSAPTQSNWLAKKIRAR